VAFTLIAGAAVLALVVVAVVVIVLFGRRGDGE
jgi:hypothetical protein